MSQPKQYNISSLHPYIIEDKNGFMIYYEDYAELKAFSDEAQAHIAKEERKSRERLDMEQSENARLKAEVERLTNTSTNADRFLISGLEQDVASLKAEVERLTNELEKQDLLLAMANAFVTDWNAAKKGGQP